MSTHRLNRHAAHTRTPVRRSVVSMLAGLMPLPRLLLKDGVMPCGVVVVAEMWPKAACAGAPDIRQFLVVCLGVPLVHTVMG